MALTRAKRLGFRRPAVAAAPGAANVPFADNPRDELRLRRARPADIGADVIAPIVDTGSLRSDEPRKAIEALAPVVLSQDCDVAYAARHTLTSPADRSGSRL